MHRVQWVALGSWRVNDAWTAGGRKCSDSGGDAVTMRRYQVTCNEVCRVADRASVRGGPRLKPPHGAGRRRRGPRGRRHRNGFSAKRARALFGARCERPADASVMATAIVPPAAPVQARCKCPGCDYCGHDAEGELCERLKSYGHSYCNDCREARKKKTSARSSATGRQKKAEAAAAASQELQQLKEELEVQKSLMLLAPPQPVVPDVEEVDVKTAKQRARDLCDPSRPCVYREDLGFQAPSDEASHALVQRLFLVDKSLDGTKFEQLGLQDISGERREIFVDGGVFPSQKAVRSTNYYTNQLSDMVKSVTEHNIKRATEVVPELMDAFGAAHYQWQPHAASLICTQSNLLFRRPGPVKLQPYHIDLGVPGIQVLVPYMQCAPTWVDHGADVDVATCKSLTSMTDAELSAHPEVIEYRNLLKPLGEFNVKPPVDVMKPGSVLATRGGVVHSGPSRPEECILLFLVLTLVAFIGNPYDGQTQYQIGALELAMALEGPDRLRAKFKQAAMEKMAAVSTPVQLTHPTRTHCIECRGCVVVQMMHTYDEDPITKETLRLDREWHAKEEALNATRNQRRIKELTGDIAGIREGIAMLRMWKAEVQNMIANGEVHGKRRRNAY